MAQIIFVLDCADLEFQINQAKDKLSRALQKDGRQGGASVTTQGRSAGR